MRRNTVNVAPDNPSTDVLLQETVSWRSRRRRNTFHDLTRDHGLASAVAKPAYFRDRRLADIRRLEAATQYGCQEIRPHRAAQVFEERKAALLLAEDHPR